MDITTQEIVKDQIQVLILHWFRRSVDDTESINADASNNLGLETTVVRKYDGIGLHDGKDPCQWCINKAGSWTYDDAKANGVWARHEGCGCTIEYITKKGEKQLLNGLNGTWTIVGR